MASDKVISLKEKLGLLPDMSTYFLRAPQEYWQELNYTQARYNDIHGEYDFIHAFFTSKEEMSNFADILISKLARDGTMWISWPKLSAQKDTQSDITEQDIKDLLLPMGLVAVDIQDITSLWSGIKFIWPENN
jgi:hypothetical protein